MARSRGGGRVRFGGQEWLPFDAPRAPELGDWVARMRAGCGSVDIWCLPGDAAALEPEPEAQGAALRWALGTALGAQEKALLGAFAAEPAQNGADDAARRARKREAAVLRHSRDALAARLLGLPSGTEVCASAQGREALRAAAEGGAMPRKTERQRREADAVDAWWPVSPPFAAMPKQSQSPWGVPLYSVLGDQSLPVRLIAARLKNTITVFDVLETLSQS